IFSLTFAADAGAFAVGGNPLTIEGGGITNSSTVGQTINDSITMGAAQTWTASANTGPLTLGGAAVSTAGFPLNISGGAIFSAAVTNTGAIDVMSSSKATFAGALANSGSLVIDSGASVAVSQPYAAAGSITNNFGFIAFGSNYTGTVGIAGSGFAFFNGILST